MKKSIWIITVCAGLYGCSSGISEDIIVGQWNVTDFDSDANISDEFVATAREISLTYVYDFNEDHTFGLTASYDPKPSSGKWELDSDSSMLVLYFDDNKKGKPSKFEIIDYTTSKMTWLEDLEDIGLVTFTLERK